MVDIKNNGILLRTYIYLMISLEKFRHGKYGIIQLGIPHFYQVLNRLVGQRPRANEMKSTRLYGWMGLQATFQNHRRTLVQHIVLIMADPRSKSGSVFFRSDEPVFEENAQKKENGQWWSTTIFFLHPKLMISHVKVCVLQYGSHDRVGFTPTVLWGPEARNLRLRC